MSIDKKANTSVEIHTAISKRWSPRAFSDKIVEEEKLNSLFEAARWAASAFNEQPWRFVFATRDNPEQYQRILQCLNPGNQEWAQSAPVLMITVAAKTFSKTGKNNRHAFHDVGLAVGNMSAQATALGLYLHQMGGFNAVKAVELLEIPDGFEPVTAIAIGYMGDKDRIPEKFHKSEVAKRNRRPLAESFFLGKFA